MRVASMVARGEIAPGMAVMFERALRDESDGKSVLMTTLARSVPKPKPPRKPSWER